MAWTREFIVCTGRGRRTQGSTVPPNDFETQKDQWPAEISQRFKEFSASWVELRDLSLATAPFPCHLRCVDDLETQPMFPDNMEMPSGSNARTYSNNLHVLGYTIARAHSVGIRTAYGAALHVANDANPNPLGDASEGEASEEEFATDDPAMEAYC